MNFGGSTSGHAGAMLAFSEPTAGDWRPGSGVACAACAACAALLLFGTSERAHVTSDTSFPASVAIEVFYACRKGGAQSNQSNSSDMVVILVLREQSERAPS